MNDWTRFFKLKKHDFSQLNFSSIGMNTIANVRGHGFECVEARYPPIYELMRD